MAWKQLQFISDEEILASLSVLVTIVSRTKSAKPMILGTAFPIMSTEKNVLLFTAAHIVEHGFNESSRAFEGRNTRALNHIPVPDNELYILMSKWISETTDLWCLITVGDNVICCPIIGSNSKSPLDISLLVVDSSPLQQAITIFQINSDILKVGDEIVLTSFISKGKIRDLIGV